MRPERIDFIKNLAVEAGKLTLEGYGKSGQIPKDVQDGYDIATEYDLLAEELVKRRILDEFSEPVLGEEDGLIGDRELAKQRLWIVDPIDGTFNYQRGIPLYGVSIAYCEEGIPVSGAIYLPVLEQLFYAGIGRGAFLAEGDLRSPRSIQVSHEREIPPPCHQHGRPGCVPVARWLRPRGHSPTHPAPADVGGSFVGLHRRRENGRLPTHSPESVGLCRRRHSATRGWWSTAL
jgi:hypothetical protein